MALTVGRALLAMLVLLTAAACSGGNGLLDKEYAHPLTPEFPQATDHDATFLRQTVNAFLATPEWSEIATHLEGWGFADVAALTRNGQRVGVYGDAAFPSPVTLAGDMTFVRCGQAETWRAEAGPPLSIAGLHVRLLDGEDGPWFVLSLNAGGELPSLRDVEEYTGSGNPCP